MTIIPANPGFAVLTFDVFDNVESIPVVAWECSAGPNGPSLVAITAAGRHVPVDDPDLLERHGIGIKYPTGCIRMGKVLFSEFEDAKAARRHKAA